jgi:hypothetical protein
LTTTLPAPDRAVVADVGHDDAAVDPAGQDELFNARLVLNQRRVAKPYCRRRPTSTLLPMVAWSPMTTMPNMQRLPHVDAAAMRLGCAKVVEADVAISCAFQGQR